MVTGVYSVYCFYITLYKKFKFQNFSPSVFLFVCQIVRLSIFLSPYLSIASTYHRPIYNVIHLGEIRYNAMGMVCLGKGDLANGLVEEEGGAKAVGVQGQTVVNL